MNIILKSLLTGFVLPRFSAMGMPKKFKTERFRKATPEPLKFSKKTAEGRLKAEKDR